MVVCVCSKANFQAFHVHTSFTMCLCQFPRNMFSFVNFLMFTSDVISNLISKLFMSMSLIFCFYVSSVLFYFCIVCFFFGIVCVRPLNLAVIKLVPWFLFSFVNSSLVEGVRRILKMTKN